MLSLYALMPLMTSLCVYVKGSSVGPSPDDPGTGHASAPGDNRLMNQNRAESIGDCYSEVNVKPSLALLVGIIDYHLNPA
jgi:hypothetical protein